jgi:hypothetical protein
LGMCQTTSRSALHCYIPMMRLCSPEAKRRPPNGVQKRAHMLRSAKMFIADVFTGQQTRRPTRLCTLLGGLSTGMFSVPPLRASSQRAVGTSSVPLCSSSPCSRLTSCLFESGPPRHGALRTTGSREPSTFVSVAMVTDLVAALIVSASPRDFAFLSFAAAFFCRIASPARKPSPCPTPSCPRSTAPVRLTATGYSFQ